jgi:hypothetical protein
MESSGSYKEVLAMVKRSASFRVLLLGAAALLVYLAGSTGQAKASDCIPNGGVDDTLWETNCCSGYAVPGSTWCDDPNDYGTTWASCHQICGEPPAMCQPECCNQFDCSCCDYVNCFCP